MGSEITYNWDDIEVGRLDLNHSENFFTQKHLKHEKYAEEFNIIRAMAAVNLDKSFSFGIDKDNDNEDKENTKPISNQQKTSIKIDASKSPNKQGPIPDITVQSPSPVPAANSNHRPANLITCLNPPQPQAEPIDAGAPTIAKAGKNVTKHEPPHAYVFKDIYQKKKEEKLKKLLEEEKKNRVFHSRPVPKSVTTSQNHLNRKAAICCKLTVPETPVVLKHSREAEQKRKEKLEELKVKNQTPRFISRKAAVLREEPFNPKKPERKVQMQPFNLHVEKRIGERKHYDDQIRRTAIEKQKQEEEERKKREEELVKEIRKLTSFKARPNPFK